MKIALINGSPKVKESTSGSLLNVLKEFLCEKAEISELSMHSTDISDDEATKLYNSDVWVFFFPLYVDAVPAHLLTLLMKLEKNNCRNTTVYGVVNCGFYEGTQAKNALSIMENWCLRAKLKWGGGVGTGGGGAIAMMPLKEHGPFYPIFASFKLLSETILDGKVMENCYTSPAFPRLLYKLGGEMGWRSDLKKNGLKPRDLKRRPKLSVNKADFETTD